MTFFFKQKTAYHLHMSYLSSDVCSSGLGDAYGDQDRTDHLAEAARPVDRHVSGSRLHRRTLTGQPVEPGMPNFRVRGKETIPRRRAGTRITPAPARRN